MPLILSGAQAGAMPLITEYTSGRVATLADSFGTPLDATSSAALPANYTYSGTSPNDGADRLTDQPSGTLYIYEDGTLHKFFACRATLDDLTSNSSKPGFATFQLVGIYGGKSDAAIPDGISLPAEDPAAGARNRLLDQLEVPRHRLPHRLRVRFPEAGAPLDIGEEKGDGSGGEGVHWLPW